MTVLTEAITTMKDRVKELEPAVSEHAELVETLSKINGNGSRRPTAAEQRSWDETWKPEIEAQAKLGTTSPKAVARRKAKRGRGRPKGAGKTLARIEKVLNENPGVTIGELAKLLKMKPNYLYRALPNLESNGKAVKREGRWFPAG